MSCYKPYWLRRLALGFYLSACLNKIKASDANFAVNGVFYGTVKLFLVFPDVETSPCLLI